MSHIQTFAMPTGQILAPQCEDESKVMRLGGLSCSTRFHTDGLRFVIAKLGLARYLS